MMRLIYKIVCFVKVWLIYVGSLAQEVFSPVNIFVVCSTGTLK